MQLFGDLRAFHDYMAIERHCSPRTAAEYCRDVDRFQRHLGRSLNDAEVAEIRKWVVGLMADGSNKPQSVHRKIAALTAYYKWLKREKVRLENPMDEIERPKCEKRLPRCLSESQVGVFLDTTVKRRSRALEMRDKVMLELWYGSGLRRAEVCGLNIEDVDFERSILRVIGKGNKERYVFLGDEAARAICGYLAARPDAKAGDALLLGLRGDRLTCRNAWAVFRDYRKQTGITNCTPHTFRHSYATHMLQNGADIVTLKELLGHSSIATTQVYTNVSQEHMRATFERTHPRAKLVS